MQQTVVKIQVRMPALVCLLMIAATCTCMTLSLACISVTLRVLITVSSSSIPILSCAVSSLLANRPIPCNQVTWNRVLWLVKCHSGCCVQSTKSYGGVLCTCDDPCKSNYCYRWRSILLFLHLFPVLYILLSPSPCIFSQ